MIKTAHRFNSSDTLTDIELTAITGIIAYVAHTYNASEDTVTAILTTAFNVNSVHDIPRKSYDEALRYMADLNFGEVIN